MTMKTKKHRCPTCGTKTIWTPETIAMLGTATDVSIAKRTGINKQNIYRRRISLGIPRFKKLKKERPPYVPRRIWNERLPEIVEMRKTMSLRQIADKYGVTREWIRALLKPSNVPVPDLKLRPSPEIEALLGVKTDREVALVAGVYPGTVSRWRKERKIKTACRSTFDRFEAKRLYESGLGYAEVAAKLGMGIMTVYKALRKNGIKSRPRGTYTRNGKLNNIDISGMYRSGMSGAEIAANTGVSHRTVYNQLIVQKVKMRSMKKAQAIRRKKKLAAKI